MKRQWFRLLGLVCALSFVFTALMGCSAAPASSTGSTASTDESQPAQKTRVAFVSYMAIDSAEWLQNLAKGLQEYQENHPNIEIKLVEATQPNEYEPKVRALAVDGYDIIITSYDTMAAATVAVANDYPDIKFGSMDGGIADLATYKNIQEFGLNRTETAYLAGIVAGKMTKANKVGMVGGADVGPINEIIAGWQQGLRKANPDIQDVVVYANTFTDPTKGKELGLALVGQGCDIIAAAAGGTGVGAAQAAAASSVPFVAWDVHYQDVLGDLELGSAVNFFDKMVIQFIEDAVNGKYQPGVRTTYGISEGAADFEMLDNSPVTDEIKEEVAAAKTAIGNGEITISTEPLHK